MRGRVPRGRHCHSAYRVLTCDTCDQGRVPSTPLATPAPARIKVGTRVAATLLRSRHVFEALPVVFELKFFGPVIAACQEGLLVRLLKREDRSLMTPNGGLRAMSLHPLRRAKIDRAGPDSCVTLLCKLLLGLAVFPVALAFRTSLVPAQERSRASEIEAARKDKS